MQKKKKSNFFHIKMERNKKFSSFVDGESQIQWYGVPNSRCAHAKNLFAN